MMINVIKRAVNKYHRQPPARLVPTVFSMVFALLCVSPASALPTMFAGIANGSALNKGALISVDQTNGAGSLIGDPTASGGISGQDFSAGGRLYGSTIKGFGSTSSLIEIDHQSGGLLGSIVITETRGGEAAGLSIGDLAFQPGTGTLYAVRSGADGLGLAGLLYTIDTVTGHATEIGPHSGVGGGGIGFAADGTLYASSTDATGAFNELHTLDPGTGAVITAVTLSKNDFLFSGLAVRPTDGVVFLTEGGVASVNPNFDMIYTVDAVSGLVTEVGRTGVGKASDLAFMVPEPASLVLYLSGLAAAGLVRRRKCSDQR